MTPATGTALEEALGGAEKSANAVKIAETAEAVKYHGVGHPLAPLVENGGMQAVDDIATACRAISLTKAGGTVSLDEGWEAVNRLAQMARKLNPSEQQTVSRQILEMWQALFFRQQEGFTALFAEDVEELIATERQKLQNKAKAAIKELLPGVQVEAANDGTRLLARLPHELEQAAAELRQLVGRYLAVVGENNAGVLKAADQVSRKAGDIRALLQRWTSSIEAGLTGGSPEADSWFGTVRWIRGTLGEAYALACKPWRAKLELEWARAEALAARMNEVSPGHEAIYITQAEHNLRLNTSYYGMPTGGESVDALVAVIRRSGDQKVLYEVARVQVKITEDAEALAEQSINDAARSVGHEVGQDPLGFAYFTFDPVPGEKTEAFVVVPDLQVTPNVYLINAAGIAPSENAIALLKEFGGVAVTTINLDMTIMDLTEIAVTMIETGIKHP